MKYTTVLFDLDDTLIDFSGREYMALGLAMEKNGFELTEALFDLYTMINRELWHNFEKGYFTKKELLSLRFDLLFAQTGMYGDAAQLNHDYLVAMGEVAQAFEATMPLLDALKSLGVKVALVSNGAEMAQKIKLKTTGLDNYFDDIYISDITGYQKPDPKFFDFVKEAMGGFDLSSTLIVGDGLNADIKGGSQYGIATCWFNPEGLENQTEERPDFEIKDLMAIEAIVKGEL